LAATAAGCGFELRKAPDFAFKTILITSAARRWPWTCAAAWGRWPRCRCCRRARGPTRPRSSWTCRPTLREKVVVGLNASGQVREFQLRIRLRFRLRTPQGKELIPETELLQQRDISFNESAVLAKEAEEGLLYRDMQSDLVQQLMRRLAAVTEL
jgi:LPS-assembly lipoprotein